MVKAAFRQKVQSFGNLVQYILTGLSQVYLCRKTVIFNLF